MTVTPDRLNLEEGSTRFEINNSSMAPRTKLTPKGIFLLQKNGQCHSCLGAIRAWHLSCHYEREDIGVRPERLLRELGETEFIRSLIDSAKSLSARVTYGRSHLPGATIGDYTNSFADGNSLSAGDGLRQISTE